MTITPLPLNNSAHPVMLLAENNGVVVKRSVLPGGVRVLTESAPGQRSTTIGFWVGVGSRNESFEEYGATHFLEHLLFKGTKRRSSLDISTIFDRVGGESNAATSKENTCYYARVLDEDLPMAIDVIGDMITSATIDPVDLENERGVILEELAMSEDDPTDFLHEKFVEQVLGGHALGRPIGGTADIIKTVSRDSVFQYYEQYYKPEELVVTAAGSLDHDIVCELVLDALSRGGWSLDSEAVPAARNVSVPANIVSGESLRVFRRSIEQSNLMLGTNTMPVRDSKRFVLSVLHTILGGGMSSRMFQEIREKRGLAYSTYAFSSSYSDAGYFGMYAGCLPSKARDVLYLMREQLHSIAVDGVLEEELSRAVGQLSGGLVLGLEDNSSRMSWLGRAELVMGEYYDVDEILLQLRKVTGFQVRELAGDLAASSRSLTMVGAFSEHEDFMDFVS